VAKGWYKFFLNAQLLRERRGDFSQLEFSCPILLPIMLAMPLAGSIAGYELTTSHRAGTQAATKQAFAPPRPMVSWANGQLGVYFLALLT
jgi:hypothetical protein